MTFDLHEQSGGEPGEFYHVSDVKGREKVEKTQLDVGGLTAACYIAHTCKHSLFLCAPGATGLHIPFATWLITCSQAPLHNSSTYMYVLEHG